MSISNRNKLVVAGVATLALMAGGAVFGYSQYKAFTGPIAVKQPLPFNHKHHMDEKLGLDCAACHKGAETGAHAGIPSVATCIKLCHTDPQGTNPEEAKIREYASKGEAIPWQQANRLPGHVYFSHVNHVKFAKMDCKECHGDMKEKTEPVTLSTTHHLDMSTCMKCHKEKGASNDCLVCHK